MIDRPTLWRIRSYLAGERPMFWSDDEKRAWEQKRAFERADLLETVSRELGVPVKDADV